MLCANTVLRSAIKGITDSLKILKEEGSHENVLDFICTWEERQSLFKLDQIKQWKKSTHRAKIAFLMTKDKGGYLKMEKVVKGMENFVTAIESKNISLDLANKMIEAALVKGKELGIPFSITIVDKPGNLKAF